MKYKLLFLCLFPFAAQCADIGMSWSISEVNQPVQLGPIEDEISAISQGLQINYSEENWLVGLALTSADTSDDWIREGLETDAELSFESYELYANYYTNNWVFSAALGKSNFAYNMVKTEIFSPTDDSLSIAATAEQDYDSKDSFYELSSQYYIDLSPFIVDLSVNFDLGVTYFNTEGEQVQESHFENSSNSAEFENIINNDPFLSDLQDTKGKFQFDDSIWLYSLATNFDYSFNALDKDWLVSVWYEKELSDQTDGTFTIIRLRDNNRVIFEELQLAEESSSSSLQHLNSYGADLNLAISDRFAAYLSWLDTDVSKPVWQLGVSYWF